jgi:CheY-like chemotaxis protein
VVPAWRTVAVSRSGGLTILDRPLFGSETVAAARGVGCEESRRDVDRDVAHAAGPAPARPQPTGRAPILVIDDDPALLTTVSEILEAEGYDVERAANGQVGLAVLARVRPALILLDMRMPILNGWQFAAALRARGLDIPVIVMTAAQDAQRWANDVGAAGYLSKPLDLLDLLATVQRFLGPPTS